MCMVLRQRPNHPARNCSSGTINRVAMTGRRSACAQLADDAQQHVSLFPVEASPRDREVDSPACGVFGRFLDIRADADEVDYPARR
jgi:hypothetical protein